MTPIKTVFTAFLIVEQIQAKASSCHCKNEGTCMTFIDPKVGEATYCECPKGFGGHLCEIEKEECNDGSLFCFNGGTCETYESGVQFEKDADYYCDCPQGFGGDHCEDQIDKCGGGLSCFNGGTCVNNTNTSGPLLEVCKCLPGYEGALCEIKAERCSDTLSCYNDGKCMLSNADAHYCSCTSRFGGSRCEYPKVECPGGLLSCLNGGKCVYEDPSNPNSFHKCSCPPDYSGSSCQIMVREKIVDDVSTKKPENKEKPIQLKPTTGSDPSFVVRNEILLNFFAIFVVISLFICLGAILVLLKKQLRKSSRKNSLNDDMDTSIDSQQEGTYLNESSNTAANTASDAKEIFDSNANDNDETTVPITEKINEPTIPQIV